ncbi:F-box domain-containing protein [Mycena kentingensis (nom. inval.)]|nr:F-box domain-containing protein [Mycena kentingensis (nom. inval.)]
MLLDFPDGVLLEMSLHLPRNDIHTLRFVCLRLCIALTPHFYRTFPLWLREPHLSSFLRTVDTGILDDWLSYARVLRIPGMSAPPPVGNTDLAPVLARLQSVRSVMWVLKERDPGPVIDALCGFIAQLRTLHELDVTIESGIVVPLVVRSISNLTSLKIATRAWNAPAIGPTIAALVAQGPRLQTLHLLGATDWNAVWLALAVGQTRPTLRELVTNQCSPELLQYLAAYPYPILETLRLVGVDEDSALGTIFWSDILPLHADTLVHLEIRPAYEGGWCLPAASIHTIAATPQLQTLQVSLNGADLFDPASEPLLTNLLNAVLAHPRIHTLRLLPARHTSSQQRQYDRVLRAQLATRCSLVVRKSRGRRAARGH